MTLQKHEIFFEEKHSTPRWMTQQTKTAISQITQTEERTWSLIYQVLT